MTATEVLQYLQKEIHSTVAATVDDDGLPATCAIDVMDADENGLYFLTARGKGFFSRLKRRGYIALTGMKGKDTMSRVAVSVRGSVRELGDEPLPRLFEKNPYMREIYPTAESRRALTVFQLYAGSGEWFDLSKKPIERFSFTFGQAGAKAEGYRITTREELLPTLKAALASPNPAFIDVRVDREENVYPMVPAGAALDEMLLI